MALRDLPHPLMRDRRAGVLLHPTSLPGEGSNGTLGPEAYRFVDFLADSGLTLWQMLPLGPTHQNRSPYQTLSVHAGNPDLIDLDDLVARQWLSHEHRVHETPQRARRRAADYFFSRYDDHPEGAEGFERFCHEQRQWLDDYALFMALRDCYPDGDWTHWPDDVRLRRAQGMARMRRELNQSIEAYRFEQFVFNQQWQALREYARKKQVALFGDMPIFVAHDSADVWSNQGLFQLDAAGQPLTVAGVPPDYFSEEGQHWGNPHYNWDEMQANGFRWWRQRVKTQLLWFDLVRLDHFRGLEAFWEIPAATPEPRLGRWVEAPGRALLNSLFREYKNLPLVAENLGFITKEVEELRESFRLPGMVVLQFAFDGDSKNPHLPHNYSPHTVVYTGTHDNDTSLGWFRSQEEAVQNRLLDYCHHSHDGMPELLIRLALSSVANLAIIPLQDLLGLNSEHRMNRPGTEEGNWFWRFSWPQVSPHLPQTLVHWLTLYGRQPNLPLDHSRL